MISVRHLTKRYASTLAVDDVSFEVEPGEVTGFLGPNGAGKTTTMRVILGLDGATSGETRIGGTPYARLRAPMREVGALIDPRALQPGRTARRHLRWLADAGRIPRTRVDDVLEEVGLGHAADRRVSGFSLGMCQRLGLAAALLGDPGVLVLDEPTNGLDPAGIQWVRRRLRQLAAEGRTVFISSHLLSEMQQTVDTVVVVDEGRLVTRGRLSELAASAERVTVRTPHAGELSRLLRREGATVERSAGAEPASERIVASGVSATRVGDVAAAHSIALHELTPRAASLENLFLSMTEGSGLADPQPGEERS